MSLASFIEAVLRLAAVATSEAAEAAVARVERVDVPSASGVGQLVIEHSPNLPESCEKASRDWNVHVSPRNAAYFDRLLCTSTDQLPPR